MLTYIKTSHRLRGTIHEEVLCAKHLAELPAIERTPHGLDKGGYRLEVREWTGEKVDCTQCDVSASFGGKAAATVALLLCLLLPSLAHAQGAVGGEHHEWWLHGAIFASGVAAAADLSSTSWALGKSGDRFSESNPALRWASDDPVKLAVAKMTVDGAVVWALIKIHPTHPKLAVTIAVAKTAVSAWAAHRNAKTVGLR